MINPDLSLAEMPGLYGPFTMAERVVQKIWLRGDFDGTRATLTDGRALVVESVGRWNLLQGPDFQGARLRIAGRVVSGDIEVHFYARDWRAHGHANDPAYDRVELHVVLFPPAEGEQPACRRDGSPIPALVLLPYLHRGLEEYVSDDALETLTERDEWQHYTELAVQSPEALRVMLRARARRRWVQKVHFAKVRLDRLGWEAALHHTALEILGYRANRAAMLTIAARYPLKAWRAGVDPNLLAADSGVSWSRSGVRPANQPLMRLKQYQHWVASCPTWPERLQIMMAGLLVVTADASTKQARRDRHLRDVREKFAQEIVGRAISGSRLDTLIGDGFLPLWAARAGGDEVFGLWFHWPMGDVPPQVRRALHKLAVVDGRGHPHCHGWGQGMLDWFLSRGVGASS